MRSSCGCQTEQGRRRRILIGSGKTSTQRFSYPSALPSSTPSQKWSEVEAVVGSLGSRWDREYSIQRRSKAQGAPSMISKAEALTHHEGVNTNDPRGNKDRRPLVAARHHLPNLPPFFPR